MCSSDLTLRKNLPKQVPEFLLRGMSYPRVRFHAANANCESFAFTFFSFYDYRCRAVHSVTLCPVETMQAHQKHILLHSTSPRVRSNMFLVDLGGFAPPSKTLFCWLHTAIIGIPPRTRTLTCDFGDRDAAITLGIYFGSLT